MDNPETLKHWAHKTQDEDKQNTTQKTKMMSNTDPTKKLGVNRGTHEG